MLSVAGDILNWLIAGVVFPLMFLPIAVLAGRGQKAMTLWLAILTAAVLSGAVFVWLTPSLSAAPSLQQGAIFFATVMGLTLLLVVMGGPEAAIDKLSPVIKIIVRLAAHTVMWLLLAMALIQFGVVILRYVFGINYIFMQESALYMHGAVFMLAAGYALATDDHVRVDIFYSTASPKRKALIDFLGTYLLLFPICLLLLWTASPYVGNSWAVFEGSTERSGIQGVFVLKSLIPIFALLIAMAGFNIAVRAGDVLRARG